MKAIQQWLTQQKLWRWLASLPVEGWLMIYVVVMLALTGLIFQRIFYGPFWVVLIGLMLLCLTIWFYVQFQAQVQGAPNQFLITYEVPNFRLIVYGVIHFLSTLNVGFLWYAEIFSALTISMMTTGGFLLLPIYWAFRSNRRN